MNFFDVYINVAWGVGVKKRWRSGEFGSGGWGQWSWGVVVAGWSRESWDREVGVPNRETNPPPSPIPIVF